MKLTGELKDKVEKTETKEEAKKTIEEAGMILDDAELDQVAGGITRLTKERWTEEITSKKLTEELKEKVEKTETKEEAKKTIEEAEMILDDTELDQVAGGGRPHHHAKLQ